MKKQLLVLFSLFCINTCYENSVRHFYKRQADTDSKSFFNIIFFFVHLTNFLLIFLGSFIPKSFVTTNCNDHVSCIRYMDGGGNDCTVANCSYILAYEPLRKQGTTIKFFLSALNAQFVGIGFTTDISKRNSEITACVKENNTVVLKMYSWKGSGNDLEPIKFTKTQAQLLDQNTNNGIQCIIERAFIPWTKQGKDLLSLDLFQIYLWGNVKDGVPDILLNQNPKTEWHFSNEKLKLTAKINFRTSNSGLSFEIYQMCGKDVTCIRLMYNVDNPTCTYETCSYNFLYAPTSKRQWEIFLSSADDVDYIAIGLTHDKVNLLDTEIMGCIRTSTQIVSFHYWISNIQQINQPQEQDNKGLQLLEGRWSGNHLWCRLAKTNPTGKNDERSVMYQLYFWGKTTNKGVPILTTKPSTIIASEDMFDLAGAPKNYYKKLEKIIRPHVEQYFQLLWFLVLL
uniref:DOMON domain-containing protein n=1 Tax=Strigamia maritima TaxID=126957 RepID=T1JDI2_STRMM